MAWTQKHGEILLTFMKEMDCEGLKFFVIRNYKGLPFHNPSKDVDIIVKHGTAKVAEQILKRVFKQYGLTYYYSVRIEESLLCRGVSEKGDFAIHIDLMNGYINRGVEIVPFDTLYKQTIEYNGFRVLNELYNGIMLFIYKQFGYKNPALKSDYQSDIYHVWEKYPEFSVVLTKMLGRQLFDQISDCIGRKDFQTLLSFSRMVDRQLRHCSNRKSFWINQWRKMLFVFRKIDRIILRYRKYEKSLSVMAPDGTGKTTFIDNLLNKLADIYVDAPMERTRFHTYHFRPMLLPNLGEIGEKSGMMKQDRNFTSPHRARPANFLSSILRITYYWADYVIGWMWFTRKDVQYDHYTVYDRFSFDLLVDPRRTRLQLPRWIRNVYVKSMPHPQINFFLKAEPETILLRKKELSLLELKRQINEYERIAKKSPTIFTIDANKDVDKMVSDALYYLLEKYWEKL